MVNVQDGSFSDLGELDPTLSWSAGTMSGDVEIEYGIEASARPNSVVDANNDVTDLDIHLEASAGDGFAVKTVSAVKGIDADGARVTFEPRYNVETEESDVVINYSKDGTEMTLTASQDAQSVTLSRQLDDDNRIAPTLNSSGDVSIAWERELGDDNSITTTLTPDESVNVEWKDAAWTATINMPLDGTDITGTNVSIKREVSF